MLDDLLPYFNQELIAINKLAEEFAKAHPKIASQLHIGAGTVQDPHVGRLIESFAFLTSHIQRKLDDDYSQLSQSLLNIIYPHYLAPTPAFSIVQFESQPELTTGYQIEKNTLLETTPNYNEYCQFSTIYPVTVWPIKISQVTMGGLPLNAPVHPGYQKALSVIRLTLSCAAKEMTFAKLSPENLIFYINTNPQDAYILYELILNNTLGIGLANSPTDEHPVFLDKSHIKPIGFNKEEGLLPYPTHSHLAYRLLTEFFSFPEKFLFFELTGLNKENLVAIGNQLEVFFYINNRVKDLEKNISTTTFQLGCTPLANIFPNTAEPIELDQKITEYLIVPDARRPKRLDIHSIQKVTAITTDGKMECAPLYSYQHDAETKRYWHVTRKVNPTSGNGLYISFTDLDFNFTNQSNHIISIESNCTNGNTPNQLPFGAGEPHLQLSSAKAPLTSIQTLMPFTTFQSTKLGKGVAWKLVSHLSLNYLFLSNNENGKEAFKEMLRLYNVRNLPETNNIIDSIIKMSNRRITARSLHGFQSALCQGTEITIQFDETAFTGSGLYIFSQIIERFFASYTSINSFTKLIVTSNKKEGILFQWPPRAGDKILL